MCGTSTQSSVLQLHKWQTAAAHDNEIASIHRPLRAEVGKAPWGPSAQLLQNMWTRYDGGLRQALGALEDERKRTREQIMELSRIGLGFRLTHRASDTVF